jgi:DNA-binding SARP family transcriptional activator
VQIRILGPLEVVDGGAPRPLGGAKQRAVLAVLLVYRGEVLSSERLIDELWGERPPASATKTLQGYVSHLRKSLGGGVLRTRGGGYQLILAPGQLDLDEFEQLVAEGRKALQAGDAQVAAERLRRALGLWRGAPLADFAYEAFAQAEIARLAEARLAALEDRIEADLAGGRHGEVVGELEGLVRDNPLRERLCGQLMLALYRSGRQAEALEAHQAARRVLVDDLGIEPGRQLRQLQQAILEQDPALDLPQARPPLPSAEAEPRRVFVGRARELGELTGGLEHACAGRGRLFLLVGEPGIGKSRLGEELVRIARARGARVLVGRCWEAGGAPPFWPWVQSLRSYVREAAGEELITQLGSEAAEIASLLPELYDLAPGLPEAAPIESDGARFRLFHAVVEFLRRASETCPIVLALDDLHAADTPSLLLVQFIARELGSMHVLMVAAMRDIDPVPGEPLTSMLAETAREPVTHRIALKGLSEAAVAEYVGSVAAELASPELVAALHADTEGNPLFVSETVRLLALEGAGTWSGAPLLMIPQSVRDVITRRLSHLSEECNRVLALASVVGREFDLRLLACVADLSEDLLLEALGDAVVARVVTEVPGGAGRLRFAHVLIRDTLYPGLTIASRIKLHREVAAALKARYGDQDGSHLAELAHHSTAGHSFEDAVAYATRAAEWAAGVLAYEEAVRLYQTALDAFHLAPLTDETLRCELLLSLGEAQGRAGNTPAAQAAFIEAADIARRLGRSRELARAAVGYGGRTAWVRPAGDLRLVPLLEEGLNAVDDEDVELRARLLARLAGALRDEPSLIRRDRLSREAVELARRSGSSAALAYALDGRTEVILAPDAVAECLALGDELCDVAQRIGDKERMVHGHMDRFVVHVLLGDIQAARTDLAAMRQIADELRQPVQLFQARVAEGMLALGLGMLPQAEKLIAGALAVGERPHPQMAIPAHRVQWCTLCEFRGEQAQAERSIQDLVADYPSRPVFRCVLAHLQAQLGHTSESSRMLQELAKERLSTLPFDQEWLLAMAYLAETASALHDGDTALVLYQLLTPWERFNAVDHPEGMRGSVSRYLGLLASTLERFDDAAAHYEAAITMNTDMGARPWLAYTQNDYARMLSDHGSPSDRQRADQLRDAARSICSELEITPLWHDDQPTAHGEVEAST